MAAVAKAIANARSTGNANLRGRNLTSVPSALYDEDEQLGQESKWWEVRVRSEPRQRGLMQPVAPGLGNHQD